MPDLKAKLILDAKAATGEAPVWDGRKGVLYWVDSTPGIVHIHDPTTGEDKSVMVGRHVGTVSLRQSGGLAMSVHHGFAALDPDTGKVEVLAEVTLGEGESHFNDGKCDPSGRYWAGSMGKKGCCKLYRMDLDGHIEIMEEGITISNGLAWSLDKRTFYYIDTPTRKVDAYDYDDCTGNISNRRTIIEYAPEEGVPDGMTIDADGNLWVAHWGGHQVTCLCPDRGEIIHRVSLGPRHVTNCAFGGMHLDELYITTARAGLSEDLLADEPEAGGIFRAKPGVHGVASHAFAG